VCGGHQSVIPLFFRGGINKLIQLEPKACDFKDQRRFLSSQL
jgi:hypothetical protein